MAVHEAQPPTPTNDEGMTEINSKRWILIIIGLLVAVVIIVVLWRQNSRHASESARLQSELSQAKTEAVQSSNTPQSSVGATNSTDVVSPPQEVMLLKREHSIVLSALTNQVNAVLLTNRLLVRAIEDMAENDRQFLGALEESGKLVRRANQQVLANNVRRYISSDKDTVMTAAANNDVGKSHTLPIFTSETETTTPSRVAVYIWERQDQVGGFWVRPGHAAHVRVLAGVNYQVDLDPGLDTVVMDPYGKEVPYSKWKEDTFPVRWFKITNRGGEEKYATFVP